MVMLFGKQFSVSATTHAHHQEAESDDPNNQPPSTRVFLLDHHQEKPASDVNLAKFRKEVDPSSFLGLRVGDSDDDPTVVLNPEPLQCFHPGNRTLHRGSCSKQYYSGPDGKKKRKSTSNDENKKKKKKFRRENYPQEPTVNLSSEFLGIIGPAVNGPVFVYRKKLEGSDVKKEQSRLLVTEEEKLMGEFLTGEEREMFEGPGLKIDVIGVDKRGREYELRLSNWKTMTVFNRDWCKMAAANGADAGHWVDLWAFRRQDGKFRLAVNFTT